MRNAMIMQVHQRRALKRKPTKKAGIPRKRTCFPAIKYAYPKRTPYLGALPKSELEEKKLAR